MAAQSNTRNKKAVIPECLYRESRFVLSLLDPRLRYSGMTVYWAAIAFLPWSPVALAELKEARQAYTQTHLIRVLESPSGKAPTLGRLRINTAVNVMEETDDWTKIHFETSLGTLQGYVKSADLVPERVNRDEALQKSKEAAGKGLPKEAIAWMDKALGIPIIGNENYFSNLETMADLHKQMGEDKKVARVKAFIKQTKSGKEKVFLAACLEKDPEQIPPDAAARVVLLAQYNSVGGFSPLTPTTLDLDIPNVDYDQLAAALMLQPWYVFTPSGGSATMEGTPFWGAQVEGKKIILGACEEPGSLYANVPLLPVEQAAVEPFRQSQLLDALRDAVEPPSRSRQKIRFQPEVQATHVFDGVELESFYMLAPHPSGAGERIGLWALFEPPAGHPVHRIGSYTGEEEIVHAINPTWARFGWGLKNRLALAPSQTLKDGDIAERRAFLFLSDSLGKKDAFEAVLN